MRRTGWRLGQLLAAAACFYAPALGKAEPTGSSPALTSTRQDSLEAAFFRIADRHYFRISPDGPALQGLLAVRPDGVIVAGDPDAGKLCMGSWEDLRCVPWSADPQVVADSTRKALKAFGWQGEAQQPDLLHRFFEEMVKRNKLGRYARYRRDSAVERSRQRSDVGLDPIKAWRSGVVLQPDFWSWAARAGIKQGDQLLTINGKNIGDLEVTASEYVKLLREPEHITWRSPDGGIHSADPVKWTYASSPVTLVSVEDGIAHVILTRFARGSAEQLKNALDRATVKAEATGEPLVGVALELYGNRGGHAQEAVDVGALFTEDGSSFEYVTASTRQERPPTPRIKGAPYRHLRVALMVDQSSCSASELVVNNLLGRAAITGTSTCGKLAGQSAIELPNGGMLTFTTFEIEGPLGKPHGYGFSPGVCLPDPKGNGKCRRESRVHKRSDVAWVRQLLASGRAYEEAVNRSATLGPPVEGGSR